MEQEMKKCKTKNCPRVLPEGYKYKYCEHCRDLRVDRIKKNGKKALNATLLVGGTIVTILTKGNISLNKKK